MFYKCYICDKLKLKKKDTYQVGLRNTQGTIIKVKYMCDSCGDDVENVYNAGRKIMEYNYDDPGET